MKKLKFADNPNIPDKPLSIALVDGRIQKVLENKLAHMGVRVIKTEKYKGLYEAISYHPDILYHHLGGNKIVYAPGTSERVNNSLENLGFQLIPGSTRLGGKYPFNIAYNVARLGNVAFHNLKFTDPVLANELISQGVELVHVNQGYAKCSISVVDENSIITSDPGIAKVAVKKGLDVLLIEPEEEIKLPGIKYGFIGGSSGLIDKKKWLLTGDILNLKSSEKIIQFLQKKCIDIVHLPGEPVVDIGSIIPLMTCE
ncbi:MAG TPA: hypothetical protein GXX36_09345 [Clostridiaceae bacterium]|nr:hypothetical protein [Clostridiaceae bacterium]